MSESDNRRALPWYRAMPARDPAESHRGVSPLELFFDLCFVVAIAQATTQLADSVAAGQFAEAAIGYLTVFFAIWWAWMNFTWFASAFNNDDVPYRLAVLVQITGALILAAGTMPAFTEGDFSIVFLGYAVMRTGLVVLWLRAAWSNPAHRTVAFRYSIGLISAMFGWSVMLVTDSWPLWGWSLMASVELIVPIWAESRGATPWNPHHIARRYSRFIIIVLGQSLLAVTNTARIVLTEQNTGFALYATMGGGLLIVFSMWWLYFAASAPRFLDSNRRAFAWGYGHYFIFGAAAAVGAGISVNLDRISGSVAAGSEGVAAALTIPVVIYLSLLWGLHRRPDETLRRDALLFPLALAVIVASSWTEWAVPVTGIVTAGLVAASVAGETRTSA